MHGMHCHHITTPPCYHAPMPPCHHATMPPCHHATMPPCHHARMPKQHNVIMRVKSWVISCSKDPCSCARRKEGRLFILTEIRYLFRSLEESDLRKPQRSRQKLKFQKSKYYWHTEWGFNTQTTQKGMLWWVKNLHDCMNWQKIICAPCLSYSGRYR